MTNAVLTAKKVHNRVQLGRNQTLETVSGVNFSVDAGQSVAIVGRSGSGKTSLLSVLGLPSRPTSGEVILNGKPTQKSGDKQLTWLRNEHIGFVFQSYSLVRHLSAAQNVELSLLYGKRVRRRVRKQRAQEMLALVGLTGKEKLKPKALSGGEQQRVAIARALVRSPQLIMADEPTGALDTQTAARVLEILISACKTQGVALIVVTHDLEIAKRMDRIYEMHEAKIVRGWSRNVTA